MENKNNDIPRRFIKSKMTKQELLILDCIKAIEELPANNKLTQVVVTLSDAKAMLSDHIDDILIPTQTIAFNTEVIEKVLHEKKEEEKKPTKRATVYLMNGNSEHFGNVISVELQSHKTLLVSQSNGATVFRYDLISHYSISEE